MSPLHLGAVALAAACLFPALGAQENYKRTDSGRTHAHHLELVDAAGRKFDPTAEGAPPFSSYQTCKTCHDIGAIEHGWHFNAAAGGDAGRPGEPWILTDERTGTQVPLSYRGWPGTRQPSEFGLDAVAFLTEFARQLPGGSSSYTGAERGSGRFRVTGDLDIDCMICHSADRSWSHERWAKTTATQDFAWASAAAMGLAKIDGSVRGLPDDFDKDAEGAAGKLPKVTYDRSRIGPDGKVFFDVVRRPTNASCMTCHTRQQVGPGAEPRWLHDQDVHIRAGMDCVDCHRNGLEHHTVRGYEGEQHPAGDAVASLSCRGCHLDDTDGHGGIGARGGRLGAPKPQHKGLPPIHLDKLSCTACHAGTAPDATARAVQTSMSHAFGVPSQTRSPDDLPYLTEPLLRRNEAGVIEPVRSVWPAYWGYAKGETITPIATDEAFKTLRRTMRVRTQLRPDLSRRAPTTEEIAQALPEDRRGVPAEEWTDAERAAVQRAVVTSVEAEFRVGMAKALDAFQKTAPEGATAVYLSGGRIHALAADGTTVESRPDPAAAPYSWPLGHDVRPARQAIGASGCTECHAADAAFVHGMFAARGPMPDANPATGTMLASMGLDPTLVGTWEQSFGGRSAFKVVGVAAMAILALVILLQVTVGFDALLRGLRRGTGSAPR